MKINNINNTIALIKKESLKNTKTQDSIDRIKIKEAKDKLNNFSLNKVKKIQEQILTGSYKINLDVVVNKMIEELI